MAPYSEDWRTIAEQASKEMDPEKLADLVSQLCCAFDERDKRASGDVRTGYTR